MKPQSKRQAFIWGALLVLLGLLLLLETFTELAAWVWIAVLLCGGLALFVIWLASNRESPMEAPWAPLIPAYVLAAIGVLVAGIELNVLRDPFIAPFVLAVIARKYKVVLDASHRHDMADHLTMTPKYGVKVRLEAR